MNEKKLDEMHSPFSILDNHTSRIENKGMPEEEEDHYSLSANPATPSPLLPLEYLSTLINHHLSKHTCNEPDTNPAS